MRKIFSNFACFSESPNFNISRTYHEFGEFDRFESFEFDPLEFLHSLFSVRLVADDRVDDRVNIVDVSALCVLTLSSSA